MNWIEERSLDVGAYKNYKGFVRNTCSTQYRICSNIPDNQPLDTGCTQTLGKCRAALRHLHVMLFRGDDSEQQCNNFALKSIRGFFHDQMSSEIDGSILFEMNAPLNLGERSRRSCGQE